MPDIKWVVRIIFIDSNLSPSADKSPSLEAEEPCFDSLTSPGRTSSDLWTVNEVFSLRPKPIRRFLPNI